MRCDGGGAEYQATNVKRPQNIACRSQKAEARDTETENQNRKQCQTRAHTRVRGTKERHREQKNIVYFVSFTLAAATSTLWARCRQWNVICVLERKAAFSHCSFVDFRSFFVFVSSLYFFSFILSVDTQTQNSFVITFVAVLDEISPENSTVFNFSIGQWKPFSDTNSKWHCILWRCLSLLLHLILPHKI